MRIRTVVAATVVALLAVGSTACSSSTGSSKGAVSPSSAATAPQTPEAAPAAPQTPAPAGTTPAGATAAAPAGAKPSGPPAKPDAATTAAYIAALTAIDPEIVSDKADRAVSRGRDQCTSVAEWPNDQAKLVDLANKRFTSSKHPEGFGAEKSARILAAVRKHICPTY
ncbi:hypothetical protein ACFQ6N_01245 [Kitasatospora sp. NPDC056446]|uniref:hypothetical protein n=1 Tax=Kitasatospora sp. NPDC056446 TaxID=3345819 RepID=UPI00367F46F6